MKKAAFLTLFLFLALSIGSSFAAETVFGPQQYIQTGKSIAYNDTFPATPGQGTLIVVNGQANGKKRVSSAIVKLNGQIIFDESDFSQSIYQLEATVTLIASNTLEVTLKNNKRNSYITVEVREAAPPPTVSMTSAPDTIQAGETSTLSWTSTDADTASIDQGIGPVPVNGSTDVSPTVTATYTITVTGPGGTAQDSTTVTVTGGPQAFPDGSFAKQYEDQIPPDSTATYDPKRFSLITGQVQDINSSPISGVSVTIHKYPEYGTATTDANGRFTIPVNGGSLIKVVYQKAGLVSAQRKVHVSWNDIVTIETIQMIAEDPLSSTVNFDGNPNNVVTHQSTAVSDIFGSRSSNIVFTGNNRAYEVDENGNVIQELATITARATEFTTPESMPAILPPNSAYTYCAELSVDGAQRVKFDLPITHWVDNFLGFNVGEKVPVGYYDRDKGEWLPSDNGVVIKLLDTDTNGVVDALDATGDDQPDDLNNNQSFSDEVTGLDDPVKYPPNSTFWRAELDHFTPVDLNWPIAPSDAIEPNGEKSTKDEQREDPCKSKIASFVEDRSRIFHEDISIPGTDITLHYASNRLQDYKSIITVFASGDTVPASLKQIIVRLEVAGRTLEQVLQPLSNQKVELVWDGLDHLGKRMKGPVLAKVKVGFVYDGFYQVPGDFAQAFGQAGSGSTLIPARIDVTLWKNDSLILNRVEGTLAEGWTISSHHQMNPIDPSTLYKGDGSISKNDINIIDTIAGNGTAGYSGDGGPATEAMLYAPRNVAADASGNLYIADSNNHRIRKIDTNGIITTVAGTGIPGYSGDGGPAINAQFNGPYYIKVDASGNLYIADYGNKRIRKIDTNGIVTTVAGNGTYGYSGDGGPATEASFGWIDGIALDTSGNLYVSDSSNYRIRKIDTNGIVTTIAGNGTSGYGGDGGPATEAMFYWTSGLAPDASGNLYVADTFNYRVRKVDQNGIITTVAGTGTYGYSGNGGPATEADLAQVEDVVLDTTGNLYVTMVTGVRMIDQNGIISAVAGTGTQAYSGDGGPATVAEILSSGGSTLDPSGNLYITDSHRIRMIAFPKSITGGDITFAEENGLGHVMSSTGQHQKTIDLDTGITLYDFGYDVDNNLISITDQFNNQVTIQRDGSGVPTAIVSPDGVTTTLSIDANNHLSQVTYPDTGYYSFTYSPGGLMTVEREPGLNRFDHTFDSNGRLTDAYDQEGGHWTFSRTAHSNGDILTEVLTSEGELTSYLDHTYSTGAYTSTITDPAGAQTLFTDSADERTVNKSLACGLDLHFEYGIDSGYRFKYVKEITEITPSVLEKITLRDKTYADTDADEVPDRITETVTVNGKATTLVTDTLQATKTITSPEGRNVTTLYDPNTLLTTSLTIPGLHGTAYGYDSRGRLTSITTNIRQTTFGYDAQGNLSSIDNSEDPPTTYSYDQVGRLTGISRPDTSSVGFTYDKNGNMTVLTNPVDVDHGFGFNTVNLNSSYQTPLSGSYSYVYDKDRRLIQTNFPSGKTIINDYADPSNPDDKSRLWQIRTPEGNIDFTYMCATKVDSITKNSESITYGYDGKLITSETLSGTLNQSLDYTYNNDFDVSGFTYSGSTVNYAYDNDGLLTGAGSYTVSRNAQNGLPDTVSGGALSLGRSFNGYGEVDGQNFTVGGQNVTSWTLTRDDNGRITQKTETVDGVISNYIYTYDSAGRLLTVTKDGILVEEYGYDLSGTRISETNTLRGIAARSFSYSDEDHLLSAGSVTYAYDLDGFLTTKTDGSDVTNYNYSSRGELLSVNLPDGRVVEYIHDPLGRRIVKKVDGGIVEKYLWQGLTRLLAVYDGSDSLLMRFDYADDRMPVAMTNGGNTYYLTYDQVGSFQIVADAAGNVVKRIEYDAFGNIINDTNPAFERPFGFAGGLHDQDTGLVRFGYRDYDPDVGRWTAKDPILFNGGDTDLYGYVLNNPINLIDPDGRFIFSGAAALGYVTYTGAMALADLTIAAALGYTAQQALESKKWDKDDRNLLNENKRMFKKGRACKPPKQEDPDKDPPPPIGPTLEQQIKREPLLARIWRALTSQWSGP